MRPIGDEAVVLETDAALARGRRRPGVAVMWRMGRVLAFVFEAGLAAERGEASALEIAERQQARLEVPSSLGPHENDDLEVPLDDPRIADLVYWLGRSNDPPGRLDGSGSARSIATDRAGQSGCGTPVVCGWACGPGAHSLASSARGLDALCGTRRVRGRPVSTSETDAQ